MRSQFFFHPGALSNNLELQNELHAVLAELNNLWDKIGALAPEDIAIRRGASLDCPGIQSLAAT